MEGPPSARRQEMPLQAEPPLTPSKIPRQRSLEKEPLCPCCHNCLCSPVRHCRPVADEPSGLLDLPDEVLEGIGAECGTDLRSLALVNKRVNLLVQRPTLWRHAYESSCALSDDNLSEWGADAMPDFLWKACVIRSAAPWPAAA